jgi:hypothetical protein
MTKGRRSDGLTARDVFMLARDAMRRDMGIPNVEVTNGIVLPFHLDHAVMIVNGQPYSVLKPTTVG